MTFANPAVVFTKRDIEYPMQTVFDPPMTARRMGKGFGMGDPLRSDVERTLGGGLALDLAYPFHPADARQLWPVLADRSIQPRQISDPQVVSGFNPAMIFSDRRIATDRQGAKPARVAIGKEFPQHLS